MTSIAPRGYHVIKFGGSSLENAQTIAKCFEIIRSRHASHTAVVVSAMSGFTDILLDTAKRAAAGDMTSVSRTIEIFLERHQAVIDTLIHEEKVKSSLRDMVAGVCHDFRQICEGLMTLRELTPRAIAKTVARGERTIAQIFCAIIGEHGIPCTYVDATQIIKVCHGPHGSYPVAVECEKSAALMLKPKLDSGGIIMIPGFIAEDEHGDLVTLGRGGSDYSATIIGAAIGAEAVYLYKEVDGLMTADPRYVPDAHVVGEFHYREAAELAYYGAKVLHPKTIIPLIEAQIPLILKNTFAPDGKGTRIAGDVLPSTYPVKALTAISGQALISVEGNGMMGVPGIAAKTFGILARHDISVSMISQSSAESSICFVVPTIQANAVRDALQSEFIFEIKTKLIDDIIIKSNKAIIAVIGLGMSGTRGTAARTFSAMAREDINIEAIAQGSSELNISFAIAEGSVPIALQALHREFKLEKLRALEDRSNGEVSLALFGCGQIGRALIKQIIHQKEYLQQKIHVRTKVIALADSSGLLIDEKGFSQGKLEELTSFKQKGGRLAGSGGLAGATSGESLALLKDRLWPLPLARGIFVDLTAGDTGSIIKEALLQGLHVVVANKKPMAVDYAEYAEILRIARQKKLMLRYEATVGAGLPVLDTLAKLEAAGDEIYSILGCLSGTLGYIMTQIEDGVALSSAVKKAFELGYTEPDPREDLLGLDVARKALILARTIGHQINMADIHLEPLFPEGISDADPMVFMENLKQLDQLFANKAAAAASKGNVLRYVARISSEGISVKVEEIAAGSPLGRLRGTNNQVCIRTRHYDQHPMIVTGPGAGADVTAAGVLNDIIAIATAFDHG